MSESKFYDLHVTGLGYLNRVRMVKRLHDGLNIPYESLLAEAD